ncbi:hypothetical protein Tco_1163811 [Tanacetum coccineum]
MVRCTTDVKIQSLCDADVDQCEQLSRANYTSQWIAKEFISTKKLYLSVPDLDIGPLLGVPFDLRPNADRLSLQVNLSWLYAFNVSINSSVRSRAPLASWLDLDDVLLGFLDYVLGEYLALLQLQVNKVSDIPTKSASKWCGLDACMIANVI